MRRLSFQENDQNCHKIQNKLEGTNKRAFGTDITIQPLRINEIDDENIHNPLLLEEYTGDIYKHMQNTEENYMPNSNYMISQKNINEKMRAMLLD